jgi:Domain of unknown function (DUF5753)
VRPAAPLRVVAQPHRDGPVSLPERDLPYMLDAYGVTDRRRRETLLTLARDATKKGWWQQYDDVLTVYPDLISLEHDAKVIRAFEMIFLPGLVQTPGYARALFEASAAGHSPRTVKRLVDVRMTRQQILERLPRPDPPRLVRLVTKHAPRVVAGLSATRETIRQ